MLWHEVAGQQIANGYVEIVPGLAQVSDLPFSPLRVICLVSWIYLCLYCVQRIQFSPLISVQYKTVAKVITFFTGPLFLGSIILTLAIRQSIKTGANLMDILAEYAQGFLAGVQRVKALASGQEERLKLLDASGRSMDEVYGHSTKKRQNSRTLRTTEKLIADGLNRRASDILIDPKDENCYHVRFRIDGVIHTVEQYDEKIAKAVVNSIKAVASMDIAEKRRPQDGAFSAKRGDMSASFRVASAGAFNGEKLSIRVLNQDAGTFTLEDIGLGRKQIEVIRETVKKPSGMMLVCGPTGSGKTTTLYAMLNEMDRFTRNVITVEDPIEAILPEASQIEINTKADITFSKALRSILRQDPDVICIGEIRDEETADIALRASQTGHLVLATMHCDSNTAAIVRLLDLGISPMLLASGLSIIYSQRLLRCLCENCKRPAELSATQIREYQRRHINPSTLYEPTGCDKCENTGYFGRTAIGDLTVLTDTLKQSLTHNKSIVQQLQASERKKGHSNFNKQGLKHVVSGLTSFEELKRVLG
ncbi:GspE/PulE family protein [Planctomycetota bacterium]